MCGTRNMTLVNFWGELYTNNNGYTYMNIFSTVKETRGFCAMAEFLVLGQHWLTPTDPIAKCNGLRRTTANPKRRCVLVYELVVVVRN